MKATYEKTLDIKISDFGPVLYTAQMALCDLQYVSMRV